MKKMSEMTESERIRTLERIKQEETTIYGQIKELVKDLNRFLFLANAGGSIAILGFMGAAEKVRQLPIVITCLKQFLIGTALSGGVTLFSLLAGYVALLTLRIKRVEFYENLIQGPEVVWGAYSERKKIIFERLSIACGVVSLLCFLSGVILVVSTPIQTLFGNPPASISAPKSH